MANRYIFNTTLTGYIKIDEPGGQWNNCTFSFKLPADILTQVEQDREELLEWAKSKVPNPSRVNINKEKWDEEGLVKYSYLGETNRPAVVFVDTEGVILQKEVLASIRKDTKVRVIMQQSPYTKPSLGTKVTVLGVQVIELNTGNAIDSGSLDGDDVTALFAAAPPIDGFKASEPQVRTVETTEQSDNGDYDF
jgi:hypothetical protein